MQTIRQFASNASTKQGHEDMAIAKGAYEVLSNLPGTKTLPDECTEVTNRRSNRDRAEPGKGLGMRCLHLDDNG
jgi:hypothetical protein